MNNEPSPNRFSGNWYVIRQGDGYKLESYYWEENALDAAKYLSWVSLNNNYYVEQRENIDE
jgi:hypothetical protein